MLLSEKAKNIIAIILLYAVIIAGVALINYRIGVQQDQQIVEKN